MAPPRADLDPPARAARTANPDVVAATPHRGGGPLLLALVVLAGALALVRARLEPPPALPVDAPADQFSAGRALARLATLVGDDVPHPVGSPAGARVRAKLLAEFTALGLAAEDQQATACSARAASCGPVGNVLARLPGRVDGPAVLVSAHHDSVPAGPGAGDDGAGVAAILELARALSLGPAPRNPVVFLLVDGEETGLLGAQAFVDGHPWAQDIGVAVNLDAGGTRGVTSITRTTPGNALVLDAFAAVPRPYGASVTGAVYGLTPYDTDFSVYARAELPSIDLGFGEDKAHYHTPLDRLANLDPASVQHLGDTALALVRRLAEADLAAPAAGDRVFLDALGLALLSWPAAWTPALALLAALLLALATWRSRHVLKDMPRGTGPAVARTHASAGAPDPASASDPADPQDGAPPFLRPHDLAPGFVRPEDRARRSAAPRRALAVLAFPLLVAVPALVAIAVAWLLARLAGSEVPGYAEPWPARLAVWSALLLASGVTALELRRRLGERRLTLALWWTLAVLAAALAVLAPAASVGVLPPVLLAAIVLAVVPRPAPKDMSAWPGPAAPRSLRPDSKDMSAWPGPAAALLCLLLPALMWLQAATRVEAIFGLGPAALGVLALLLVLLAPLWPTRAGPWWALLGLATVAGAAWTLALPAHTEARPRRLSLVLHQDADTGAARWLVDADLPLPDPLRAAAEFTAAPAPAFPWTPDDEPSWSAPASPIAAPPPELALEPGVPALRGPWGRHLRLRLRSPRGARTAALVIPDDAGVRWLAVSGVTAPPYPAHRRAWYLNVRHHPLVAVPADGLVIDLVVREQGPVELTVLDASEGLPPAGAALQRARPAWAVPSHGGDRTVLSRRFTF